jgi:hypothetical protein
MSEKSNRRHINQLVEKLKFLATEKAAQTIHGCVGYNALARRSGINQSSPYPAKPGS